MPKAHDVAQELRKLADVLDTVADAEVESPMVSFYHHYSNAKDKFLALASIFPRPFTKKYENRPDGDLTITHKTDLIWVRASIARSLVCRIVEPAKPAVYDCEPLLSSEEEESLAGAK